MIQKPLLFSLPQDLSPESIANGFASKILDTYHYWLEELSELEHTDMSSHDHPHHGNWAYFPWRQELIHIPEPDAFRKVFFSRNFPIIDRQTQNRLWELQVAVAGLSVGSNIAIELVKAGVRKIKIADFDTLAPSNNNRITGGSIFQIGENKAELLAKKLYELNPYCEIELFPQGLTNDNFNQFVHGCDVLVDEIDAFPLKNRLREYIHSEKGKHAVLITGADLGENPIVEIESQADPKFGGRVTEKDIQYILQGNPNKVDATRMLVSVVGRENIPASFLQNFINIKQGEQTYWAQVGLAATAVAAKITEMVVEVARGNTTKLKRIYHLELNDTNDPKEEKRINHLFDKEFGYLPVRERTLFLPDEAALGVQIQTGDQTMRQLYIGDLTINIREILGENLTKNDLTIIHEARHSYNMWGEEIDFVVNDPSDEHSNHLIASVIGPNQFRKIFALKTTTLSYDELTKRAEQNDLPIELGVWKVKNKKTGIEDALWNHNKQGTVVITSRFCSFAERKNEIELEKEATTLTFAAMQLFVTDSNPDFVLAMITPESIKKLFSIKQESSILALGFTPIEKTLGLKSWQTVLDETNPTVAFHKSRLPRYWAKHPKPYLMETNDWRQSAITLLKAAKEKYS